MADRDFMLIVAALLGFGIGWFVFDYLRRPAAPATTSYYAQVPPWAMFPQQPQYQPQYQEPMGDHVQNDEETEVSYNRDGSIKSLKTHRDIH